jgi:hypothetical protein
VNAEAYPREYRKIRLCHMFSAGILPALAQRSATGPHRRQVYVPILDRATQDREVALDSVEPGDARQ